jgi:E3 ubiquitin-protein ligase HECTD1
MDDVDATIYKYVQQLINPFPSSQRYERIKRIFEPTYTIIYTEKSTEKFKNNTTINLTDSSNDICSIDDILELLRQLYYLSTNYIENHHPHHDENYSLENYFNSKKLNNKLLQQIQDSILIASSSLPSWTSWLMHSYKFLYPFETRQLYFRTTSFGTSRSIVWLQERREELIRTIRNGNSTRSRVLNENSLHDFRFGRLKIDRAVAIDRENVLHDAMNLFHYHAKSKSKLEIQFVNEEGTGDGPTLEFYALIANDLQKYQLGLWWNHDDYEHHQTDYVRKLEGLFPVPYPQDHERLNEICSYFCLMGIYFGKCLLDKYLIDMPLSIGFLKILCTKSKSEENWYDGILDLNDLILIEPTRGRFFQKLYQLIEKRNKIINDENKSEEEKQIECQLLKIENDSHEPISIEHLWFV